MSAAPGSENESRVHPREVRAGDVRVRVGRWPGGRALRGRVLDYSEGGLRIQLPAGEADLEAGSPVSIEWKLPGVLLHGSTDPLTMDGHVRRRDPQAGVYGVSFERSIREHS